jgi:hypothetical protein
MANRPAVPEDVKRQLRQEAGFGCCLCGLPIFDYQHIVPYSERPHFKSEDMMILCPWHHREATVGALTEAEQRKAKARPFNIVRGYADGLLKLHAKLCAIAVGSVQFVGEGVWISIDGEPLLRLAMDEQGRLEISLTLYDHNGALLAIIERNEWISGDPLPWDIESGFQTLRIRRKHREVVFDCDVRQSPPRVFAELWKGAQLVSLRRSGIFLDGDAAQRISIEELCLVAFRLELDTRARKFHLVPNEATGKGTIVSWPDSTERLRRGLDAWFGLKGQPTIGRT